MSNESSFDENQANDSIIKKVKTRVSNIFPSVANWFSSSGPVNNGSVRRRRESESNDENSEDEGGNQNLSFQQSKRRKSDVITSSNSNSHAMSSSSTTNIKSSNRRFSMPINSTPDAQNLRHRKLLAGNAQQQQMTSSPYDFKARNPSMTLMASPIQINDSDDDDEEGADEVQLVVQPADVGVTSPLNSVVSKRKNIHETQYNVLRMSNNNNSGGDRSTSEPPTSNFDQPGPSSRYVFGGLQNEVIPENETVFTRMNGGHKNNDNDDVSEAESGSDFMQPMSRNQVANHDGRLSGFLGNRNKNISASTGQLSFQAHLDTEKSLFANNDPVHQRTYNSSSVYGSSWSLNSGNRNNFHRNFSPFYGGKTMYGGAAAYSRRDMRLQQTLRVPTMIRPSSRLSNASSTSSLASIDGGGAGGSNASAAAASNQQNKQQQQHTGLSNTSKRILELLNQCTSPLKDARKMGTGLNTSIKVPTLMNNSTLNVTGGRFNETDLNLSRTVRLQQPKTPYSRPNKAPTPLTTELQIPTISQLLQMKRLLNSTAQVKQMAAQSKSVLNAASEYTLPGDKNEKTSSIKYTSKVKEKISSVREKTNTNLLDAPEPVNLPNVQLSGFKSIPQIDIPISAPSSQSSIFTSSASKPLLTTTASTTTMSVITNGQSKSTNIFGSNKFTNNSKESPFSSGVKNNNNNKKENEVISLDDTDDEDDDDSNSNIADDSDDNDDDNKNSSESEVESSSDNGKFKFSSPVPILNKKVPSRQDATSDSSKNFKFSNPLSVANQQQQQTTTLESFKPDLSQAKRKNDSPMVTVEKPKEPSVIATASQLKQGSCLDALFGKPSSTEVTTAATTKDSEKTKPIGFGNQFKMSTNQWECQACMVRNDSSKEKCVACNTPKEPAPAKATSAPLKTTDAGFANLLAAQKSKWSCPTCMSQNDQSADKCAACTEPKPGGSKKPESSALSVKPTTTTTTTMDSTFKQLVEKQKAKWECSACLTQNESNRVKCACCEEAKPGSSVPPEKVPQFSFNASSSGSSGKFLFGVPQDAKTNTSATANSPKPTFMFGGNVKPVEQTPKNQSGFMFGTLGATQNASNTPSSLVPTKDTKITPASDLKTPQPTTDNVSSSTTSNKPAIVAGGFSFGVASSSPNKTNTISSLADTSTNRLKRPLDEPDTKSIPFTNEAQPKPIAPKFGAVASSNTVSSSAGGTFTFGATPTTSIPKADSSSAMPSTNITFGSGISGIKPLNSAVGLSATSSTTGLSTTTTTSSSALNTNKNNNGTNLIFGAAKKDDGIKPTPPGGFTFGQSTVTTLKPAESSTSIFGGQIKSDNNTMMNNNNTNENKVAFSFGGTESKNDGKNTTFGVFGAGVKSTGFSFDTSSNKTEQKSAPQMETPKPSVFGGASTFGSPSLTDASKQGTSIFGGITAATNQTSNTTSSPFVFGQASTTNNNNNNAPQLPSYNSATTGAFSTPSPIMQSSNIFGSAAAAATNNSPAPSIFGQTPTIPSNTTFGQQSPFGGSTTQAQSPFGSSTDGGESANKKLNTGGFSFSANTNTASSAGSLGSTPFVFGGAPGNNMDNNNTKGAFNFSPQVKPVFNFTSPESAGLGSTSNTTASNIPFQFGAGSTVNSPPGVFTFGATPVTTLEPPQNQTPSVFEFGASQNLNNNASNPFIPGQSVGMQQRRKIKATRRIVR